MNFRFYRRMGGERDDFHRRDGNSGHRNRREFRKNLLIFFLKGIDVKLMCYALKSPFSLPSIFYVSSECNLYMHFPTTNYYYASALSYSFLPWRSVLVAVWRATLGDLPGNTSISWTQRPRRTGTSLTSSPDTSLSTGWRWIGYTLGEHIITMPSSKLQHVQLSVSQWKRLFSTGYIN